MLRQQSTESDWDKSCRVQKLNRGKVGIVLGSRMPYTYIGCIVESRIKEYINAKGTICRLTGSEIAVGRKNDI
jgi:hypothetical protein